MGNTHTQQTCYTAHGVCRKCGDQMVLERDASTMEPVTGIVFCNRGRCGNKRKASARAIADRGFKTK